MDPRDQSDRQHGGLGATRLGAVDKREKVLHPGHPESACGGVRQSAWQRFALPRTVVTVEVHDRPISIKVVRLRRRDPVRTAEFENVGAAAAVPDRPTATVLSVGIAAAEHAGLRAGATLP